MKKFIVLTLAIMAVFAFGRIAFAEDAVPTTSVDGVAGCAGVTVDPSASLEFQQNICNTAEGVAATSCGASGHGSCSSPKFNDTMPEAGHCICISETADEATTS